LCQQRGGAQHCPTGALLGCLFLFPSDLVASDGAGGSVSHGQGKIINERKIIIFPVKPCAQTQLYIDQQKPSGAAFGAALRAAGRQRKKDYKKMIFFPAVFASLRSAVKIAVFATLRPLILTGGGRGHRVVS
jgi:hypothetical protein